MKTVKMSKNLQVILLENIDSIGEAGDIVSVSEGYARNFLFPQGKAALATESVRKERTREEQRAEQQKQLEIALAQEKADALDGAELVIEAKVKDGEDIFGSITGTVIAKELSKQSGLKFTVKDIVLDKPIVKLGTQKVIIRISNDIEASVQVTVSPDPGSQRTKARG